MPNEITPEAAIIELNRCKVNGYMPIDWEPEAAIIELNRCKVNGYMPIDWDRRGRAIERANAALRKQIPMKVGYDDSMSPGFPAVRCGRCTELVEKEYSYCPSCGQSLDWDGGKSE